MTRLDGEGLRSGAGVQGAVTRADVAQSRHGLGLLVHADTQEHSDKETTCMCVCVCVCVCVFVYVCM